MLTEERVREIAHHESDNGEGCMIAVFFIILFFIAIEVISKIDYRLERIENKTGIPVCKVWSIRNMRCE